MGSNFRPNIRLLINIYLVAGNFAIAFMIAPISELYQQKT